ncbi:hypothetical protein WNY51_11780 [Pseudocolwellia sp. AS88]|uniref:hypothetical protein n=1 Tax=Pseudocolwellia sp. AS88 TaxID=3063958 RepID=UPI0026F1EB28|nr:hypothetical protein [Pseudocolwellia sp. AS88]MDO7085318.1 hypothetical protein [Pseudocolwellia sp. AS88]
MKYLIFILVFFLYSCADTNSRNNNTQDRPGHIDDLVIGLLKSNDTASKCEQGHVQDRIDCRKRKKAQVDAIKNSIKKHTEQ